MIAFGAPWWLVGLLPLALLALAVWRALGRRAAAAARFAGEESAFVRTAARGHVARSAALLGALGLCVVALARPLGPPRPVAVAARDVGVVVAVDVSLSMLARDATPSRFERARLILRDLLPRLAGDRVGMVAFAGSSGILIPLTTDVGAAELFADQLAVQSVDEPGTALDRAVERAVELFDDGRNGDRVLVVLSDGEDQSGDPVAVATDAADLASEHGISTVAVSIGSESGAAIPLDVLGTNALKRTADGSPVVTKAHRDAMAALGADGLFIQADTGDEAERIAAFVAGLDADTRRTEERANRPELFQIPLGLAAAILVLEYLLAAWRP